MIYEKANGYKGIEQRDPIINTFGKIEKSKKDIPPMVFGGVVSARVIRPQIARTPAVESSL